MCENRNMGHPDGFRLVRMAWFGPWDPKKFLEMQRRNPEIKPDEFEFIKANSTLVLRRRGERCKKRRSIC